MQESSFLRGISPASCVLGHSRLPSRLAGERAALRIPCEAGIMLLADLPRCELRGAEGARVADIFVSYSSSDRDWAHWTACELAGLGHVLYVHEWKVKGGDNACAWMERRHDAADRVLCVVSDENLKASYSTLRRSAALWQAITKRPGFVLLVSVKPCVLPHMTEDENNVATNPRVVNVRKRPVLVKASFAKASSVCDTQEKSVAYEIGDIIVSEVEGELWPVRRDRFSSLYGAAPTANTQEPGIHQKRPTTVLAMVPAIRLTTETEVEVGRRNDPLSGKPGGWPIHYASDDQAIASASKFSQTYDTLSVTEPCGPTTQSRRIGGR